MSGSVRTVLLYLFLALMAVSLTACVGGRRSSGSSFDDDDDDSAVDDDDATSTDDDDDATPTDDDDDDATPTDDDDDDATPTDDDDDATPTDDDDDATPTDDDDDTTPTDDDDDTTPSDDDDDSTPISDDDDAASSCSASVVSVSDNEPNDTGATAQVVSASSTGFSVSGFIEECGDGSGYPASGDIFAVTYSCDGSADISLSWTSGASDIDFQIFDGPDFQNRLAEGWDTNLTGPESATLTVGAGDPIYYAILCWEGAPADYEFEVAF